MNNTSKSVVILAVVLALAGCAIISTEESDAASSTIYVGGDGADDSTGDGTEAKPYASLSKAITKANAGDTVILKGDLRIISTITIEKDVNIDLNGNEITFTLGSGYYDFAITSGKLTVTDGKISDTRTTSTSTYDLAVFNVYGSGSSLSLDGVTVNSLYADSPLYRPDLPGKITAAGSYF